MVQMSEQEIEIPEIRRYLDSIRTDTEGILRAAKLFREPPRETKVDIASLLHGVVRQVRVQSSDQIEIIEEVQSELHDVLALSSSFSRFLSWPLSYNGRPLESQPVTNPPLLPGPRRPLERMKQALSHNESASE